MNKYQESLNYIIDKYLDMHYEGKPMNEDIVQGKSLGIEGQLSQRRSRWTK